MTNTELITRVMQRLSGLACLLLLASSGAWGQEGSAAPRQKRLESYRELLAGKDLRGTITGNQFNGKLGEEKPGGILVEVWVTIHDNAEQARASFEEEFPAYWTVYGKALEKRTDLRIYARLDPHRAEDGRAYAMGLAIGECLLGDVVVKVAAFHVATTDTVTEEAATELWTKAGATVRRWLGTLGAPAEPAAAPPAK